MQIKNKYYRSIWLENEYFDLNKKTKPAVCIINQLLLPFEFKIEKLYSASEIIIAIKTMLLRGAPLIGGAGSLAVYLAVLEFQSEILNNNHEVFLKLTQEIKEARPTAVNLAWAVDSVVTPLLAVSDTTKWAEIAKGIALKIIDDDAEMSHQIGLHGVELIKEIAKKKNGQIVNILTHCNAGWLATIDFGTATAPIYEAHKQGVLVHVWVDETRPRNQGAKLTAFELAEAGIPHTVIADNTGGHLMQHNLVDLCIVGCDRATANGDAANKIGTYLKALAAKDNNIPFYVALPSSTFDWRLNDGVSEIPIEERDGDEVRYTEGWYNDSVQKIACVNPDSPVLNLGFDVTPARLISGFITERGIVKADRVSLAKVFPEYLSAIS